MLCLGCVTSAWAEPADPVIEVRGRLRIELDRVERLGATSGHTSRGLVVSGVLLDESLGEPMPARTVAVDVVRLDPGGEEPVVYAYAIRADIDGGFRFEVPLSRRAPYRLRLRAGGDGGYAPAAPIERVVDLGRRAIELRLFAPAEQPASSPTLPVIIEAVALDRSPSTSGLADAAREDDLPVELQLDGRAVATMMLKDGRATTSLPLGEVTPGTELTLHAAFAGDADRAPAEASARVRLVEAAMLDLASDRPQTSADDPVALSGRLRFGTRTIAGLPVVVRRLAASDEHAATPLTITTQTEADGGFHVSLPAPRIGPRASFEASFPASEARSRGLSAVTSEIVVVEIVPRSSVSLTGASGRPAWFAIAVGLATALAVALLHLLAVIARRRRAPAAVVAPAGRVAAARGLFGTLRLASHRAVGGRIREIERGRTLADVRVTAQHAAGDVTVSTDETGAFAFAELERGPLTLLVEHPGYMPLSRHGTLPHRGELAALDLELVPLRAELLRCYAEILAPYVPPTEELGRRTPRELALLASALDPAALASLRALVEEACFGVDEVTAAAIEQAIALGRELPAHRDRA